MKKIFLYTDISKCVFHSQMKILSFSKFTGLVIGLDSIIHGSISASRIRIIDYKINNTNTTNN